MELSVSEIAKRIFGLPVPMEPRTFTLGLEEQTMEIGEKEGMNGFVSEILSALTLEGIRVRFPDKTLIELTNQDVNLIKRYVESFGYILNVYGDDTQQDPWSLYNNGVNVKSVRLEFKSL